MLYFDKKERRLIYSHPETYLPDPSKGFLSLQEGEHVVQVFKLPILILVIHYSFND